jgi:hypothetical protein
VDLINEFLLNRDVRPAVAVPAAARLVIKRLAPHDAPPAAPCRFFADPFPFG